MRNKSLSLFLEPRLTLIKSHETGSLFILFVFLISFRGIRLSIVHPEITEMQTKAIIGKYVLIDHIVIINNTVQYHPFGKHFHARILDILLSVIT